MEVVVDERTGEELTQSRTLRIGSAKGEKHRKRADALTQVRAGRLAGVLGLARDVEQVVGELEGDAELLAVRRDRIGHLRRAPRGDRADPAGRSDQRAGLALEHVEVMRDRVLTLGGADGLEDLPGAQALERTREQTHDLRAEVGRDVGGPREQEVAGEDGDRVVPARVGRGCAAPQRGLVHYVIVVQRGQMRELDDDRARDDAHRLRVAVLRGNQSQQRTEPLPTGTDQVARRLGDEGVVAHDRLKQRGLDIVEAGSQGNGQLGIDERQPERQRLAHVDSLARGIC